MLIYDRCKLVSEFIVASTWFTLHGVPPRLTQGDWHEISIPYTRRKVFVALSPPCLAPLVTHAEQGGEFPVFTNVQITTDVLTFFGVNFGVRMCALLQYWSGWRTVFCVLKRGRWGM